MNTPSCEYAHDCELEIQNIIYNHCILLKNSYDFYSSEMMVIKKHKFLIT